MVGIIIALILRGVFILRRRRRSSRSSAGSSTSSAPSWCSRPGARRSPADDHDDEVQRENFVVRTLRRIIDISDHYDGAKLRTVVDGKKIWTPMIMVFVAIGVTDLLFAIDSIPAIFGITQSPFIVFTANIFALMGLRQLYFLLGDLLDRLRYLHYGIAFILAFIGVKLVLPRHARERGAVHQRRRADRVGARDLDLDVARRHRDLDGRGDDREPRGVRRAKKRDGVTAAP